MNKKEYFSQLIRLYEATNAEEINQTQQEVADSGSDLEDQQVDPNIAQSDEPAQEDFGSDNDLNDAAYLNSNLSASNDASTESSTDQQKLVELFELMRNLLNYAESFSDTLENVELNLLDEVDFGKTRMYKETLNGITDKVKVYLEKTFKDESYEKNLYAYIILRTELLTAIKSLREVLKLNEVEDK